jgi:hypothetical protein
MLHGTRDVIKDDFGGKLPSGRPFRPDVHARPRLPRERGFTCGRVFSICRRSKNRVRADTEKKIKKIKFSLLVVVAGLERENFFSIFGFRFSIPKIPKLPKLLELRGLRGRSREKKKVFSA